MTASGSAALLLAVLTVYSLELAAPITVASTAVHVGLTLLLLRGTHAFLNLLEGSAEPRTVLWCLMPVWGYAVLATGASGVLMLLGHGTASIVMTGGFASILLGRALRRLFASARGYAPQPRLVEANAVETSLDTMRRSEP